MKKDGDHVVPEENKRFINVLLTLHLTVNNIGLLLIVAPYLTFISYTYMLCFKIVTIIMFLMQTLSLMHVLRTSN